jgi:hypothetical protein
MSTLLTSFETVANIEQEAIGDSGDIEYIIYQSFQIPSTNLVTLASLYLQKDANVPTDSITVRIETDSSGPSGTLADANATTTIAPASVGTSVAFVDGIFGTPFSLTGSTTYWIKASVPAQATGKRFMWQANTAGGYANGEMKYTANGGALQDPGNHDCLFKIWGPDVSGGAFLLNFI